MDEIDEADFGEALDEVRFKCKAIRLVCFVVVAVYAGVCGLTVLSATGLMGLSSDSSAGWDVAAYTATHGVLLVAMLVFFAFLFNDVVGKDEIFSVKQADRLRAIALLSFALFLVDLVQGFGAAFQVLPAMGVVVDVNSGVSISTTDINAGMLVFSAIMYSLSAIFRYAALLQQLSDDTV